MERELEELHLKRNDMKDEENIRELETAIFDVEEAVDTHAMNLAQLKAVRDRKAQELNGLTHNAK